MDNVIAMIVVFIFSFIGLASSLVWIESEHWTVQYRDKPYCQQDTAKVFDKEITLRRCWRAVEVDE